MVIHHLQCLCKGSWILRHIATDLPYLANTHTHGSASYMEEYLILFWFMGKSPRDRRTLLSHARLLSSTTVQ